MKSSVLIMLNNLINRAVYKILKVSDKDVICHIRQCLGLHDIDVLCKERHDRFLRKTGLLRHAVLHSLTAQFFIVQSFCSLVVSFNFLGVHVLHVLCLYLVIVILYVLLCCHVRRNKDTHNMRPIVTDDPGRCVSSLITTVSPAKTRMNRSQVHLGCGLA